MKQRTRKTITAVRKRAKKNLIEPFELLSILIEAVGAEYHKDPSRAGVITSRLVDGTYYMSIVRYGDTFGGSRTVVLKEHGPDFAEVLRAIAKRWHTAVTPPPIVDLVKKLGAALA